MKTEIENRIQDSGKQDARPGCDSNAISATPHYVRPAAPDQTDMSDQSDMSYPSDSRSLDETLINSQPMNPTIQESSYPTIRSSTHPERAARSRPIQPYLGVSRLKKNSRRSRLNPAIAPAAAEVMRQSVFPSALPLTSSHALSVAAPSFCHFPNSSLLLLPSSFPKDALAQHSIAKIPIPVFSHPFASPRQGCASPGKATQAPRENTSASLACKVSFLFPMPTPQPFAGKTLALLRFVARNCALSLIIARYVGIPWHFLLSRCDGSGTACPRRPNKNTHFYTGLHTFTHFYSLLLTLLRTLSLATIKFLNQQSRNHH
jgi:hypothetical protein